MQPIAYYLIFHLQYVHLYSLYSHMNPISPPLLYLIYIHFFKCNLQMMKLDSICNLFGNSILLKHLTDCWLILWGKLNWDGERLTDWNKKCVKPDRVKEHVSVLRCEEKDRGVKTLRNNWVAKWGTVLEKAAKSITETQRYSPEPGFCAGGRWSRASATIPHRAIGP